MTDVPTDDPARLSRRSLIGRVAAAASAAAALPLLSGQAPAPPPSPAAPARRVVQGGTGPIKVLFISAFHPFDRENLFATLDAFGDDITWTHIEHPAAEEFYAPRLAASYDVYLFYDAFAGRVTTRNPDGTLTIEDTPPTPAMRANLKQLLLNGDKGFVFFHHALASWAHTWPEYREVMGGAADWGKAIKGVRGKDYPASGALANTQQHITIVDRDHPITRGVGDFDIVDEAYLCPIFEDSVHPLMRTDFKPVYQAFPARPLTVGHPPGSNLCGWVKSAERSPVAYIQHGHDNKAWTNPAFRKLILNAIKWAASSESKAWARANPQKIFA